MKRVTHGDKIGSRESELGILATARRPFSSPFGEQSDARSDHRCHPDLLGDSQNLVKLLKLLHDENHLLPQLQSDQRSPDKLIILVAVSDHKTLRIGVHGDRGDQLRLTPRLDPKVVWQSGIHDLLHNLAKLIHLDRENSAILIPVPALLDRTGEGFIEPTDTIPEQIMTTH